MNSTDDDAIDAVRVAQYDALYQDLSDEAKRRLDFYLNILRKSIPNMGEKMAKSHIICLLRWEAMTPQERDQASKLGWTLYFADQANKKEKE